MGVHYGKADFITYGKPSLFLDFANKKSLTDRISGNNLITFTRTSTGTYMGSDGLIKVAPADSPRFDHRYVNGEIESLGLLIEESRVNYALRSEEFNLSPNSAINASISPNATIAPDGTLTADKLVEDNISSIYKRVQQGGFTVSGDYTVSFFVKEAGRYRGYIQLLNTTNASVSFNLQDGTASGIVPSRTKIEPYPNGWYRVSTSNTFNAGETPTVYIVMLSDSGQSTYTGDGSSGLYIWGLQVEPGAFPTSYIPTSGSTATRTPDNVSMVGDNFSDWYNQSEGTVYADTKMVGVQTGRYDRLWAITNSNLNLEGISLYVAGPAGTPSGYVSSVTITNSATEQVGGTLVESALTTPQLKSAFAFKQNNCASSYNGQERFVDNIVDLSTFTTPPDRLFIGQPQRYQGYSCMTVSQLTYYPTRLSNSQLQTLTK